jgi:MFS family permease
VASSFEPGAVDAPEPQSLDIAPGTVTEPTRAGFDAWWTLTVVSTLYVASYLNRFIVTMVVPDLKASLKVTDLEMGIILGPAFAFSYAAFGIPFGWAADRYSRRMVILAGTILFALSTAASGLATSFAALLLLRVCVGLGESSLSPAALSLVAQKFPKDRLTTAISIFSTGPKLGTAVAFAAGGLIVAAAATMVHVWPIFHGVAPWRVAFLITALPSFLLGLLCLTFREPPLVRHQSQPGAHDSAIRFLVEQRGLMIPMLIGFGLLIICGQSLISWVPAYLQRVFHWSPLGFGPILGLVSTIGAASLVVKGLIMDRLFARGIRDIHIRFYTWLLIATFPISAVTFVVPSKLAFVLCYAVVGVITIPCIAYASVAIQMVAPPPLRGRVFATFSIPLALIGGIGPPLIGALTDYVFHDEAKVGWSLTLLLGLAIPGAIVALRMCLPGLRHAIDASERYN